MAEETIKFEAQIDGNPAPEIKWYLFLILYNFYCYFTFSFRTNIKI